MKEKILEFNAENVRCSMQGLVKCRTKEGTSARIVCNNAKGEYPLVVLVDSEDGETCCEYRENGKFASIDFSHLDLVLYENIFEEGDYFVQDNCGISIFRKAIDCKMHYHAMMCYVDNRIEFPDVKGKSFFGYSYEARLATDEEKKAFNKELAKSGKIWDNEKKELVDINAVSSMDIVMYFCERASFLSKEELSKIIKKAMEVYLS